MNKASLFLLASLLLLVSCKSKKTTVDEQKDYTSYFERQESKTDSLYRKLDVEYKKTSERLSNLKVENTTTYYTLPDSVGRQYPVVVSTTKADKNEEEKEELAIELSAMEKRLQAKIDSIGRLLKASTAQKEVAVELSWWDMNKGRVLVVCASVFALLLLIGIINYKLKKQ